MRFESKASLQDHKLRLERLALQIRITGNATPASKVHAGDMASDVVFLRSEGKTSAADAVDSGGSFTSPVDNSGGDSIFGILIATGKQIDRVHKAEIIDVDGTATSLAISKKGASSSGVTASGNMALEVAGTGLNLASENLNAFVIIDYMAKAE